MPDNEKLPTSPRSKSVSIISGLLGLVTAGIELPKVLSRTAGSIDMVLLVAGLLVAVMGLVLLFRRGPTAGRS